MIDRCRGNVQEAPFGRPMVSWEELQAIEGAGHTWRFSAERGWARAPAIAPGETFAPRMGYEGAGLSLDIHQHRDGSFVGVLGLGGKEIADILLSGPGDLLGLLGLVLPLVALAPALAAAEREEVAERRAARKGGR